MPLHYFKKNTREKHIIFTVSRITCLGTVQNIKRKFESSAENTWKIDTDVMICSYFFVAFSGRSNFITMAEETMFPKIRL